jgi:hypothetical protein
MTQPSLAGLVSRFGKIPSTGFGQARSWRGPDFCGLNRGWATFKRPLRDFLQPHLSC